MKLYAVRMIETCQPVGLSAFCTGVGHHAASPRRHELAAISFRNPGAGLSVRAVWLLDTRLWGRRGVPDILLYGWRGD